MEASAPAYHEALETSRLTEANQWEDRSKEIMGPEGKVTAMMGSKQRHFAPLIQVSYEPYKLNTAFGKAYLPQQFVGTGSKLLEKLCHEQA
jgi:hypothetical protein